MSSLTQLTFFAMRQIIAENQYYKIEADLEKKRSYITVIGFWSSPSVVPHYLEDIQKTIDLLAPRFTTVVDFRQMAIHPPDVREKVHEVAVDLAIKGGSVYAAKICSPDMLANMQVSKIVIDKKARVKMVASIESADVFLDTIQLQKKDEKLHPAAEA